MVASPQAVDRGRRANSGSEFTQKNQTLGSRKCGEKNTEVSSIAYSTQQTHEKKNQKKKAP